MLYGAGQCVLVVVDFALCGSKGFAAINSFDPATVILPARVSLKFFQNELQNFFKKFTKKTICDFISHPILIKFSKDHA